MAQMSQNVSNRSIVSFEIFVSNETIDLLLVCRCFGADSEQRVNETTEDSLGLYAGELLSFLCVSSSYNALYYLLLLLIKRPSLQALFKIKQTPN